MNDKVTTQEQKFACLECKNNIEMMAEHETGDIVECPHCGIEYEVTEMNNDEEFELTLLEEEK